MQDLEPDFPDSCTCCATPLSPYKRLPQQLLRLSVLKLDGSRFEVKVSKMATVAELKVAVEEVFSLALLERHIKISWSHVWGHFYLCYRGQKLINNKAPLRLYGIKDEDQLQFVQNQSSTNQPDKRRDAMLLIDSL